MQPKICYVTPSHAGDIERFEILRHSINIFSPGFNHYVLLDTEDINLFKERFSNEKNLFFVSSQDLLPAKIEQRRIRSKSLYGKILKRLAWRTGLSPDKLNGWRLQQLLKIYFLSNTEFDCVVFLDSDIVFCGLVDKNYYFNNDKLVLLQTPASAIEDYSFEVCTHITVRSNMALSVNYFNYIHQAPRFYKSTASLLLKKLIEVNGDAWCDRFIEQPFPSEYSLLGYSARELQFYADYYIERSAPDRWLYKAQFVTDKEKLDDIFSLCEAENGSRKFILIQSNLCIPAQTYKSHLIDMLDGFSKNSKYL